MGVLFVSFPEDDEGGREVDQRGLKITDFFLVYHLLTKLQMYRQFWKSNIK